MEEVIRLKAAGELSKAKARCLQLLKAPGDHFSAYNNLAMIEHQLGNSSQGLAYLEQLIHSDPNIAYTYYNKGVILENLRDYEQALQSYQASLKLYPDDYKALLGFTSCLHEMGCKDEAREIYQQILQVKSSLTEANIGLAEIYIEDKKPDDAIQLYKNILQHEPDNPRALYQLYETHVKLFNWQESDTLLPRLYAISQQQIHNAEEPTVQPFVTLRMPWSPRFCQKLVKAYANHFEAKLAPIKQQCHYHFHHNSTEKIRIAYISGSFRNHPTSHLACQLFGLHDRQHFEVYAYSYSNDDDSYYRKKIQADCDHFINIIGLSNKQAADRIYQDGIHILIDLAGWTRHNRLEICALRPAPITVRYLASPDSSGTSFVDYAITDSIITPAEEQTLYTEKLVLMPHTYQINDHHQKIASTIPSRRDCGLPETGIVFCVFNNAYKIEPKIFTVWMNILKQVPNSVLWLLATSQAGQENLRHYAEQQGVAGNRLIFAKRLPKDEHLSRSTLADLYLDTLIYNAHTTASDALFAGVPVITCPGNTFARRVAASLLHAIGLSKLIMPTLEAYQNTAIHFALQPKELARLKTKLQNNIGSMPLFDTPRFVNHLETAYKTMWENHLAGKPPQLIDLASLRDSPENKTSSLHSQ